MKKIIESRLGSVCLWFACCPLLPAQSSGSDIITTVVLGGPGFSGDGGPAIAAGLQLPGGIAVDNLGNIFVSDTGNYRVRKVTPQGIITTVAGNGIKGFSGDGGPATSAELSFGSFGWALLSSGLAIDASGNLFIADALNNRIRKVTPEGIITTVAGNGTGGYSGDGGPATSAAIYWPLGVAVDESGNLFIADNGDNGCIRKVTPEGIISTVAGGGTNGLGDGGPATSAEVCPMGVAVDASGDVFVADCQQRIRKVTTQGIISTVAGNGGNGYSGDGGSATSAQLSCPTGVAVDAVGNLFIADGCNEGIRKVSPQGHYCHNCGRS